MLFSRTEDLLADPLSVHESVLRFLGLPSVALPEYPRRNVQDYSDMKPETRRFLVEYFDEANRRLYEYLGRDFGWER